MSAINTSRLETRVWNKISKSMHEVAILDYKNQKAMYYDKNGKLHSVSFDNAVIMQKTGLGDDSPEKKDICENDIVICDGEQRVVEYIGTDCQFLARSLDSKEELYKELDSISNIVVVGNIFENPSKE